jgi:hypothetical protein
VSGKTRGSLLNLHDLISKTDPPPEPTPEPTAEPAAKETNQALEQAAVPRSTSSVNAGSVAPAPSEPTTPLKEHTTAPTPAMVRRSWYVPLSAADALSAAVEDLHYETRRPKHEVLAALLTAAVKHKDDVRKTLTSH